MSAWIKQIASQVELHGADAASWYAFWDEPDGTRRKQSCGVGKKGKKLAQEKADRIAAQLKLGTYESDRKVKAKWGDFAKLYKEKVLSGLAASSIPEVTLSLNHFARILNLDNKAVASIDREKIDTFRAKRRAEKGKKPGSILSPASVNKDLRNVKAALRVAVEWGYLDRCPKFDFEREPKKLPCYVSSEHFAALYEACDKATQPAEFHSPGDWWRGVLIMAQMTGWRIGEILALEWRDVDLDRALAITRATDNKGKRDEMVALHPIVVEHLRPLKAFHPHVFPWEHNRRHLDTVFASIQDAAGINLPCPATGRLKDEEPQKGDVHECTDACHRYGFHDFRRAFATLNAENMTREALQALMRHASPLTTAKYINMARQLTPAVANLHVPTFKKAAGRA